MASIVDSNTSTTDAGNYQLSSVGYNPVGQAFTANTYTKLYSAKFSIKKVGSPTGSAYAKLWAVTGTYGSSAVPTGSALATSNALDVSTLSSGSTSYVELLFTGAERYVMTNGTYYIITLEYGGGDGSNSVFMDSTTTSSHSGNLCRYYPSSWTAMSGQDLDFYVYGEVPVIAPTVTTQDATNVAQTSCTGNGNITDTGGANATRRGFCYKEGTSGDPTTSDSVAYDDGSYGTGAYTKTITGLKPNTTYRVRAYAVNTAGTGYGTTVSATTDQSGRFFLLFR